MPGRPSQSEVSLRPLFTSLGDPSGSHQGDAKDTDLRAAGVLQRTQLKTLSVCAVMSGEGCDVQRALSVSSSCVASDTCQEARWQVQHVECAHLHGNAHARCRAQAATSHSSVSCRNEGHLCCFGLPQTVTHRRTWHVMNQDCRQVD